MVNYINRIENLQNMISGYIDRRIVDIPPEKIRAEYRQLKYELREDAKYLDQVRNKNGSILYKSAFSPSIREADAFGFTVPVNAAVNFQMFSAGGSTSPTPWISSIPSWRPTSIRPISSAICPI